MQFLLNLFPLISLMKNLNSRYGLHVSCNLSLSACNSLTKPIVTHSELTGQIEMDDFHMKAMGGPQHIYQGQSPLS